MTDAATSQPGTTPAAGASNPPAAQDPGATTTPPAATPAPAPAADFDPTKLTGEQLAKVLENQELWKNPRLAGLLESDKKLKELTKKQDEDQEKVLTEQKKFEELAQKKAEENAKLVQQIKDMAINQALTNKLVKENVVSLDGALKLVDKSKITVDDNGQVTGVDEALASLKTDSAYLFTEGTPANNQPKVGTPSNPTPTPVGPNGFKFKESQLTTEFYQANKAEVDEAGRLGLVEPDGPPPQQ
jgi:flagellar motor protein MotB